MNNNESFINMLDKLPWKVSKLINNYLGVFCKVCGNKSIHKTKDVVGKELIKTWELSSELIENFNAREGTRCYYCGCALRVQQLAGAIVDVCNKSLSVAVNSFSELCNLDDFRKYKIAEINCCGALHGKLKILPNLSYSEYQSTDPTIPSEDMMNLSYPDSYFDVVLTSDVMEHLPELDKAFNEIARVIKPGGFYIFTIPVLWERENTRKRAEIVEGKIRNILPPSYHGSSQKQSDDRIVFYEFGKDVLSVIDNEHFDISYYQDKKNPSLTTFIAARL